MKAVTRATLMLALLAGGCGAPDSAPNTDGTWVGTITTEGNVTTVINESGSVWAGTATLVEEASIGVESGNENYMFARLAGVYASGDEIYVLDNTPALRVFDYNGAYLRNLGGEVHMPGDRIPVPAYSFVTSNTLVTQSQDEAGTIMVKRYRLVLPGVASRVESAQSVCTVGYPARGNAPARRDCNDHEQRVGRCRHERLAARERCRGTSGSRSRMGSGWLNRRDGRGDLRERSARRSGERVSSLDGAAISGTTAGTRGSCWKPNYRGPRRSDGRRS